MILQRLLVFLLIFQGYVSYSQDAYFTNINQSLIYLNPSYAGSNGFIRIQSIARIQDYNSRNSFITSFTSIDAYIKPASGALAFSYFYDNYSKGQLKSWAYSLAYAQHIFIFDKSVRLVPSIQAALHSKQLKVDNLHFGDTINLRSHTIFDFGHGMPVADKTFFDMNAGLIARGRNSSFGLAIFHLNQPDEGLLGSSKLPFRINAHGAYNFKIKEELDLSLSGLYINQNEFWDAQLNCNLLWNNELFVGIGMWKSSILTANIGFQANIFRLGFGYNYNLDQNHEPGTYGKAAIELMLGFYFTSKNSENSLTADWRMW